MIDAKITKHHRFWWTANVTDGGFIVRGEWYAFTLAGLQRKIRRYVRREQRAR